MSTGSPRVDAQADFGRARRARTFALLAARLRREPDDVSHILPFDEVVEALGHKGERSLGLQIVEIDSIVGTVDRARDFDRSFRPMSPRVRARWERIAAAMRRGEAMPPVDLYRIADLHFVKDGHHRVSVARTLGLDTIEAYVAEVITAVAPDGLARPGDLALKSHERLFFERVPLSPESRERIQLSDEWRYAGLAEGVEAWGFRFMQDRGEFMTREEVAAAWFARDYLPVVEALKETGLIRRGTDTEAYMRVVHLRYLLLRTHAWDEDVVEELRRVLDAPAPPDEDTLVHRLRQELS